MCVLPTDPKATAVYPQLAAPTTVKMIDARFLHDKNYLLLYKSITRVCKHMFNTNVTAQFKVSNTPTLCRRPSRYVLYKGTFVPYDGTFGVSNQGQTLDM